MLRLLCVCLASLTIASCAKLDVVYEWKYFDYAWRDARHKDLAIKTGDYNYTAPVIIDMDQAREDGRIFVTIIRTDGVPASLATIYDKKGAGGPLLAPYPNWSWAKKGECKGITNVYRIAIDKCNRLWVLDTGRIGEDQVCQAQLLAFDLATDRLLKRVIIPNHISQSPTLKRGLLVTPVVETHGFRCQETYVYMADVDGYGLVVYDGTSMRRLNSDVFGPKPDAEKFTIEGESFTLADGVLGMAEQGGALYFRSLASYDMNAVTTAALKKTLRSSAEPRYSTTKNLLPSQAVAQAFSSTGALFFGLTKETSIACWNRYRSAERKHIVQVARDPKTLQFASGVKVINRGRANTEEEVWVVTNRLQKVMAGTMDFDEVNFRILRGNVLQLIANTDCLPPHTNAINSKN